MLEPFAKKIKTYLQYVIGTYLFIVIGIKAYYFIFPYRNELLNNEYCTYIVHFILHTLNTKFLNIVSQSILVSAGIELAYMLFTPGPDEAIEPLLLGIAGTALLTISDDNSFFDSPLSDALVIFIYSVSLFILFFLRLKMREWFPSEFNQQEPEKTSRGDAIILKISVPMWVSNRLKKHKK